MKMSMDQLGVCANGFCFWIEDFRVVLSPLQSVRAIRLHRRLRGRHLVNSQNGCIGLSPSSPFAG